MSYPTRRCWRFIAETSPLCAGISAVIRNCSPAASTLREIYPPECGCRNDGRSGLHWTPVDGSTLLHLAIDFRENEIFAWLLAAGADIDARASIDADGFGGHSPLFNAVVSGPGGDATFADALLARGASREGRATVRKFLDWCEQPRWHEARDVTPAEWARTFPERGWVNHAALSRLEASPTPPPRSAPPHV